MSGSHDALGQLGEQKQRNTHQQSLAEHGAVLYCQPLLVIDVADLGPSGLVDAPTNGAVGAIVDPHGL